MKILPLSRLLSGFLSTSQHNANMEKIEDAFENTLSRDGSSPNAMQANLDMGSNRLINVGAPVEPNDAVRLQDITDIASGGITLNTAWANVTDKPTTFAPSAHTHPVSEITGFTESVEDTIGGSLLAGTNLSVSYDDVTGKTTISNTAPAGGDLLSTNNLSDLTNVSTARTNLGLGTVATHAHTEYAAAAHTHVPTDITGLQEAVEDYIGSAVTAGANVTVSYNDATGKTTITASSGSGLIPLFTDFGGATGNTPAANNTALTNAEASSSENIWLPEGTYSITTDPFTLTKNYVGPGRFFRINYYRHGVRNLLTNPGYNVDSTNNPYGQDQVTPFSDVENIKINPSVPRHNLNPLYGVGSQTRDYFGQQWAPHWLDMTVEESGGYSGLTARMPSGANAGDTSVTLDSSAGLSIGDTVGFGPVMDDWRESKVLTNIVGNTIHWAGGLANSYPVLGGAAGEGLGPAVSKGSRTWNSAYMVALTGKSGGDNIAYGAILDANYTPTAGQRHFFNTQTTGVLEGVVTMSNKGNYGKITEFSIIEPTTATGGNGAIADVRTLYRNKSWEYGAVWGGYYISSAGTRAVDFALNLGGTFMRGLDTVRANFSHTSSVAVAAAAAATTVTLDSVFGAVVGGTFTLVGGTHTITAINTTTKVVTFTPGLIDVAAVGAIVTFNKSGAAINLATGHKTYFNSSVSTVGHPCLSQGEGYFGNVLGDTYMHHDSDGSGGFWEVYSGAYRLRLRNTGTLSFNGTFSTSGGGAMTSSGAITATTNIGAGTDLSAGGNLSVAGTASINGLSTLGSASVTTTLSVGSDLTVSGSMAVGGDVTAGNLKVGAGGKVYVGTNSWIDFDGTSMRFYMNGVLQGALDPTTGFYAI